MAATAKMPKATTVGTLAVLALTGGIAYRAVQSSSTAPAAASSNKTPAPAANNRARTPLSHAKDHRAEGPCQVIRDFLDHKDEDSKESPVSGHVTVANGGDKVDLSFNGSEQKGAEETDCGEGSLTYLMALVPDPVNSHLALSFDRTIGSLVDGATAAKYSYVNYYFPWQTDLSGEQPDLDMRKEQLEEKRKVEKWPGLLLFRGPTHPLAVFLVAETPTAGINRIAFQRTLSYLPDGYGPIPVIGPSFSGSANSLVEAIQAVSPRAFRVFNASATSDQARKAISDKLKTNLVSFIHPDSISYKSLPARRPVAILSEEATLFGVQMRGWRDLTFLPFPREISQLRNATPPAQAAPTGSTTMAAPTQLLPLDLRDETIGHDSIRHYSEQMPSSQDAVVANIARELKQGGYQFVGIMASDPLDSIFLSRAIKELCPDVRLFSLDNDLLFVRAAADSPLTGMLSVSTYPLFLANQKWVAPDSDSSGSSILSFPNQVSEATYNATVAALSPPDESKPSVLTGPLVEYVPPICSGAGTCDHAPIWVTVLGRGGYWPVSLIPTTTRDTGMASWGGGTKLETIEFDSPSKLWTAAFVLMSMFILFYGWMVIRSHVVRVHRIKHWHESFWVIPIETHAAGRAAYLTAKTLAILSLYCILIAPTWRTFGNQWRTEWIAIIVISLFLMFLLLAAAIVPFMSLGRAQAFSNDTHGYLTIFATVLCLAYLATWFYTVFGERPNYESLFLAWRSVGLLSGVSPMLPLLLVAGGVLWWAWMHFRRLLLLDGSTPVLPDINYAGAEFDFGELGGYVNQSIRAPFFHWKWRVVIAVLIFATIMANPQGLLSTIEGPSYEWLYRASLGLLAALVFLTFSRMLVSWGRLKCFLEQLDRHPLREAFSAMPKEKVWSPVMQRSTLARSYILEARSLDSARKIREMDPQTSVVGLVQKLEEEIPKKQVLVAKGLWLPFGEARRTYGHIKALAEVVTALYLADTWRQGSSELLGEYDKKVEGQTTDRPDPLTREKKLDRVASEMVALPYLFYIRVSLLQIHNLLFFVIGGFVLMVCSLGSYAFQAPRSISWCMTVVMIALGIGAVRMLAQMSRDTVLSRITETEPGKLDSEFYVRIAAAGGLPVLSIVVSQFPSVGQFLFSWLQPTLEALK